jgi:hypothetical protein
MASAVCGCFYCCRTFPPGEIAEWVDDGIDSVIGDRSGFPVSGEFLSSMRRHWF